MSIVPTGYRSSLKAKFNLAVAGLFLAAVCSSLFLLTMTANSVLTGFAQRIAVKQAQLERNKIVSVIEREVALARTLATDPVVRDWIAAENDPVLKVQAFKQLEHYRAIFKDRSFFVVVNADRHYYIVEKSQIDQTPQRTTLNPDDPHDRWYFSALNQDDEHVLNLDYDRVINAIKVWINVVIKDQDGRKIGMGGGGIDISDFIKHIVDGSDKGVTAIVVDKAGIIQAHPDHSIMEHNAKALAESDKLGLAAVLGHEPSTGLLMAALGRLASGGAEVESFPVRTKDGPCLAAVTFIPEIGWYNLVLVDVSGVASAETFWPMVAMVVVLLLLVMVCVTVLLGRLVLRPLAEFTKASAEVAQGNYTLALPVDRDDEIGRLSVSFNHMAAQVHDYTANLEQKVTERTAQLSTAYNSLEQARQRMLESLRYAEAIQRATLPPSESLAQAFSEYMTLYLPRDIVGGDLYYFRQFDTHCLLGIMDCTGHGVPGAFMSMTVHSVLNHVVSVVCSDDPARILAETDRVLRATLGLDQAGASSLDCGLEMGLCLCRPAEGRVVFAGAGIALHMLAQGELRQIKGDRQRLGFRGAGLKRPFTNHVLENVDQTRFYATTDGVLDESGGAKGYGFGEQRYCELLQAGAHTPMSEQAALFQQALREYRGRRKQRDDITMIGFRL